MLPLNTVPITRQELQELPNAVIVHAYSIPTNWIYNAANFYRFRDAEFSGTFRIAAHDYRHYFGEVVDLASKVNDGYLTYLGSDFKYDNDYDELTYCIREVSTSLTQFEGTEPECKQWLIDHFTAIAAKDLPNYNLKFIFS
jgi:hypothetical protein